MLQLKSYTLKIKRLVTISPVPPRCFLQTMWQEPVHYHSKGGRVKLAASVPWGWTQLCRGRKRSSLLKLLSDRCVPGKFPAHLQPWNGEISVKQTGNGWRFSCWKHTWKPQVAIQPAEEKTTRDWHFPGDRKDIPIHKWFGVELPKM